MAEAKPKRRIRVQRYFGVHIPPFKENKLGAGTTTIRFILTGKFPSKKNNMQSVCVRQDAKNFLFAKKKKNGTISFDDALQAVNMVHSKVRPNEEYNSFIHRCKPIIQSQMQSWSSSLAKKGLVFPIPKATMTLRLYFKDRYITDTVNKQQSIQDLLVESGVVVDDAYKTLNPIHSASACFYEEIIHDIAFISLSFKL